MSERLAEEGDRFERDPRCAELADLVALLPEDYGFDDATRNEIAHLSFDDDIEGALATVIAYLDSDGRIEGEQFLIGAGFLEAPPPKDV